MIIIEFNLVTGTPFLILICSIGIASNNSH